MIKLCRKKLEQIIKPWSDTVNLYQGYDTDITHVDGVKLELKYKVKFRLISDGGEAMLLWVCPSVCPFFCLFICIFVQKISALSVAYDLYKILQCSYLLNIFHGSHISDHFLWLWPFDPDVFKTQFVSNKARWR